MIMKSNWKHHVEPDGEFFAVVDNSKYKAKLCQRFRTRTEAQDKADKLNKQ